jgi:preprotein translocase SecE subunit
MAVAVKNSAEASAASLFDRLPVAILAGVLYVVASLLIVFWGLSALWWDVFQLDRNSYVAMSLLFLVIVGVGGGLFVLGLRLMGPNPARGLRPGIAFGLVAVLVVLVVARWIGFGLADAVYEGHWFGASGRATGVTITAVITAGLFILAAWLFTRPRFEQFLLSVDDQGWFTAAAYKRSQGQRVRRGTILGILVLSASGVYSLIEHGTLSAGSRNWELALPFSGRVIVSPDHLGDFPKDPAALERLKAAAKSADANGDLIIDRYVLRDVNAQFANEHAKVKDVGGTALDPDQLVSPTEFEKERAEAQSLNRTLPQAEPPAPATGPVRYASMTLLPDVQFTVPLLLAGLALWFAWRIVNLPAFADFLIATEAEMNKVSWTTRTRLIQDTIVVLTCVVLLAIFLLFADMMWSSLLKFTGVIKARPAAEKSANLEVPW